MAGQGVPGKGSPRFGGRQALTAWAAIAHVPLHRTKVEVYSTGDVRWLRYSHYGNLNLERGRSAAAHWATKAVNARGPPTQGPPIRTATETYACDTKVGTGSETGVRVRFFDRISASKIYSDPVVSQRPAQDSA